MSQDRWGGEGKEGEGVVGGSGWGERVVEGWVNGWRRVGSEGGVRGWWKVG